MLAIVVPTYNSSATIADTLRSLLEQTRLNAVSAVYLADDGSNDGTLDLALRIWTRSDVPLRPLVAGRNMGQWQNVNRAIAEIGRINQWILILHSDDIAKPEWLDQMCNAIETADEKVASICSSWDVLYPDGSVDGGEENPDRGIEYISGTPESIRSTLIRGCWWHISGGAIRARSFLTVGEFSQDFPHMGDWEWLIRSLCAQQSVLYIPRALILYRQHQASVSSTSFRVHRDVRDSLHIIRDNARYLSAAEILKLYRERFVALGKRAAVSLVRRHFKRAGAALALMAAAPWIAMQAVGVRRQR